MNLPSSSQSFFHFSNIKKIKNNFSNVKFQGKQFLKILTTKEFPEEDAKKWVSDHFYLALQISLLYVIVIFGTKFFMKNRQPFNLFILLSGWNLFLAIFSFLGTINLTPEFFSTLFNDGFENSYCKIINFTQGRNGYWVWLFIISKMFELIDTIFVVLRKRPLLFLHWYHHILTMIYAFFSYPISPGFNRWGIYLNYFVHSFMYSYYFLRSIKVQVPSIIPKFITTIQILQFIISLIILVHLGTLIFLKKIECDLNKQVFLLAVIMDSSYLILFINFFLQSYVLRGGKNKYQNLSTNSIKS